MNNGGIMQILNQEWSHLCNHIFATAQLNQTPYNQKMQSRRQKLVEEYANKWGLKQKITSIMDDEENEIYANITMIPTGYCIVSYKITVCELYSQIWLSPCLLNDTHTLYEY